MTPVDVTLGHLMNYLDGLGYVVYYDPDNTGESTIEHEIELGSNSTTWWDGVDEKIPTQFIVFHSRYPNPPRIGNYFHETFDVTFSTTDPKQ